MFLRQTIPGFPQRLRQRREEMGWSQDDLAAEINENRMPGSPPKSRLVISRYECGTASPSAATMVELARALGCGLDWLCGLESNMTHTREGSCRHAQILVHSRASVRRHTADPEACR
jgi:transcriptional regulator with XRE-family HTH domain